VEGWDAIAYLYREDAAPRLALRPLYRASMGFPVRKGMPREGLAQLPIAGRCSRPFTGVDRASPVLRNSYPADRRRSSIFGPRLDGWALSNFCRTPNAMSIALQKAPKPFFLGGTKDRGVLEYCTA
jgi:hypothetical protein